MIIIRKLLLIITLYFFTGLFLPMYPQVIVTDNTDTIFDSSFLSEPENDLRNIFFSGSDSKAEKPLLRLAAGYSNDSVSFDPLVIYFDINATYNFDSRLDALKLFNTDANVTNFYSFGNDGSKLSINALPYDSNDLCTVRLGIKTEKNEEVSFILKDISGDFLYKYITIIDSLECIHTELNNNVYKAFLPAGLYENRFYLILSNISTSISIPENNPEKVLIYTQNGTLKTRINISSFGYGIISIYNLYGQVLYKYKIFGSGDYDFYPQLIDGMYIVTITYNSKTISRQIIFQNG